MKYLSEVKVGFSNTEVRIYKDLSFFSKEWSLIFFLNARRREGWESVIVSNHQFYLSFSYSSNFAAFMESHYHYTPLWIIKATSFFFLNDRWYHTNPNHIHCSAFPTRAHGSAISIYIISFAAQTQRSYYKGYLLIIKYTCWTKILHWKQSNC